MTERRGMTGQPARRGMASWSWVPPAVTGRQVEGTGLLPFGRYEMPDGSQQVSFGLPQGLLDAYRSVRYGLGYEQDPNAPKGYTSFEAMNKGAFGAAGGAITGVLGAGTARALKSGLPRNTVSSGGAPEMPKPITAYHGSPHDFDRFDLSKIGTGEGAQAYGHGLYFAESPNVARSYQKALSSYDLLAMNTLKDAGYDVKGQSLLLFMNAASQDKPAWAIRAAVPELREATDDVIKSAVDAYMGREPGRLYKVEINAKPEQFLDWDKPLSQQSKAVQEAAGYKGGAGKYSGADDDLEAMVAWADKADLRTGESVIRELYKKAGSTWLEPNKTAEQIVSQRLKEAGIPGIRYLDQGSRGSGQGTYNYVIFDDSLVKIAEKYGFVIPGPNGMPAVSEENYAKLQKLNKK